jgi:hypothetical protein
MPAPYVPPRPPIEEEVSVELVTLPSPTPTPFEAPELMIVRVPDTDRPLTDLNRRDLLLLGAGGFGVLLAVGAGYALTSLLKTSKPVVTDEAEK